MEYGHDLIFGMFITPQNQHPQDVVRLGQLTGQAGLDLVTFMDHPYNPGFLDTWTLLSYVAAKTGRVRLSGYILSSAFRTPCTPSSGSGELGPSVLGPLRIRHQPGRYLRLGRNLGHGRGAAHASGVRECALSEAIDTINGIWDVFAPGMMRSEGKHYRVPGTMRGPLPAHNISIWAPAAGSHIRRLVGRKAHG